MDTTAQNTLVIPKIGTPYQGGIYAGIVAGKDGAPDYHLIHASVDFEIDDTTWQGAIEAANKRANALAAVLIELRDTVTHEHESKEAFIARVRAILGKDPDLRLCKRCGGIMRPGIAMGQTWSAGIPDFPGQDTCITMSPGGPGRVIGCMKCEACGWSQT